MDLKTDVGTNLWVFPCGMKRSGEAGLVTNVLWLAESSYPEYDGKTEFPFFVHLDKMFATAVGELALASTRRRQNIHA
jgi:penicillin V acylase-like amidase (Ntn superfamily)